MNVWTYTFISVAAVSALSLAGVFALTLGHARIRRLTLVLVSFAVGGLLGDAFFHLLPEAYADLGLGPGVAAGVLAGILGFFVLEKFLRWRHCHDADCDTHALPPPSADGKLHPVVVMNLLGDGVHNFIDGAIIAAAYGVNVPLGFATTLAVLLHELPQEMGDYAILVHGGLTPRRALGFNFLSSLAAAAGAALVLVLGAQVAALKVYLLPVTAGGFIYIAAADLIPELTHDVKPWRSLGQLFAILAGAGVMAALTLVG